MIGFKDLAGYFGDKNSTETTKDEDKDSSD